MYFSSINVGYGISTATEWVIIFILLNNKTDGLMGYN